MKQGNVLLIFFTCSILAKANTDQEIADTSYNSVDSSSGKYDEYPMVVPKRGVSLLDRLMVALQRVLEDDSKNSWSTRRMTSFAGINPGDVNGNPELITVEGSLVKSAIKNFEDGQKRISAKSVGLQRRGHGATTNPKGRVWRCYFNAVTCF